MYHVYHLMSTAFKLGKRRETHPNCSLTFSPSFSIIKTTREAVDGLPMNSYINNRIFGEGRLFFMSNLNYQTDDSDEQ